MRRNISLFLAVILIVGFAACEREISVTNVTLNKNTLVLIQGDRATLVATVLPNNATNSNIVWTRVATVSNGVVTALAAGTTTITARTEDGGRTVTSNVEVFGTTDAGIEVNGVRWATRNVAIPGAFAHNREDAGMFYQWNRDIGWSAVNPMTNSDGGTAWSSTNAIGTSWETANDPCPTGWRVPTFDELNSLRNTINTWETISGANGRLFGTAPNQVFLPAAGLRDSGNGALEDANAWGNYWSSTQSGSSAGRGLFLMMTSVFMGDNDRAAGQSVRCVAVN